MSEQDAGNHTCEAESRVSMETSQPETFSLDGPSYPSPSSEPHAARTDPTTPCTSHQVGTVLSP
ncbi:hypothetical protein MDA_GLEAN10006611 [Myotis davidii]|uniref:Uncharacterized protein n=1 Tax=Myotis davidii TaxID=225400 RepID=L5MJI3_MYODS|nr:hypothetical protein MDA_GLEAN10006611 [Myotis davidii]